MSGKDERRVLDVPICPKCGKQPKFWTFHRGNGSRMCQLYSRRYALVDLRSFQITGNALGFYTGYESIDDVKYRVTGVWCRACARITDDAPFVTKLVNIAKQLEKTGYVDNDEW